MKRFALFVAILLCCSAASSSDAPKRPRILGILSVRILAHDVSTARGFYSRVLSEDHPCVWCGQKSRNTFSVNYLQYIQLAAIPPKPSANLVDEITFETDDVPSLWKYLTSRGINSVGLGQVDESPAERQLLEAYQSSPQAKREKAKKEKAIPDVYFSVLDHEGHRIGFVQLPADVHKPPTVPDKLRLIHVGIIVNDRAGEDHFYKDVLGFHIYWHGGMKDDKDDWVAMQVPDGTDWVEYMLNVSSNADKQELGVMNHFAVGVADVAQTAFDLRKKGLSLPEEPQIGRDGKWQLNVYDPDLTRIEFMEFTPVQKPCCSDFTGPHPKP